MKPLSAFGFSGKVFLCVIVIAGFSCTPQTSETVLGIVIDYSPASSEIYIGSPSIAVLPNGDYVASHDFFGPGSQQNRTRIFLSQDKGQSWEQQTDLVGQWWSTLFVHQDRLYIMGTSRHHGYTVIRRSSDGGATWTEPVDDTTGLLLADAEYHCAPVPVLRHNGRLWRAMEDTEGPGNWGTHFRAFMMSAPLDADLLNAASWTCSNRLDRDSTWLDGRFRGWLEGNAVATPKGEVVNILRVDYKPEGAKAAVIQISEDGKTATFDPASGFIDFPGGCKKFTIRYDTTSQRYWSLSNVVPGEFKNPNPERTRNTLALISSRDLQSWRVDHIVLQHPDVKNVGFQYADWLFENKDIIAVVRTAHPDGRGGAHNCHDANYMTFHRIENFRQFAL